MKNIFFVSNLAFLVIFLFSCLSLKAQSPYSLQYELETRSEGSGISFYLSNNSQKTIEKVVFALSFYDENGETVPGTENLSVPVSISVLPESEAGGFISEGNIPYFPEGSFEIDWFYAEEIWYSDGSVFEDPFGRFAG